MTSIDALLLAEGLTIGLPHPLTTDEKMLLAQRLKEAVQHADNAAYEVRHVLSLVRRLGPTVPGVAEIVGTIATSLDHFEEGGILAEEAIEPVLRIAQ